MKSHILNGTNNNSNLKSIELICLVLLFCCLCVIEVPSKAETFFLRQHQKCLDLKFKPTVKRQERVNARVRYIEGTYGRTRMVGYVPLRTDDEDTRAQNLNK